MNLLGSIFWFAVAFYVCLGAYKLGFGTFHEPGPGFIFMLSGLFLAILSAIDLLKTLIKKTEINRLMWSGLRWPKVILILISLVAYHYFFVLMGFILSTFLLMLFLFKAVEPTKWWVAIISTLITTLAVYIIFDVLLSIPFPKGVLGV